MDPKVSQVLFHRSAAFSLAHQPIPLCGHDVPVLQVENQLRVTYLAQSRRSKARSRTVTPPSARGTLTLTLSFCQTNVLLQCSFILFVGLALFQEAQLMEGFCCGTMLQRSNSNPDCT